MSRRTHGKQMRGGLLLVDLRCGECRRVNQIVRRKQRPQGHGHQKTLWCPWCKRDTVQVQITDSRGVTA